MSKFVKVNDCYIGAKIKCVYYFTQIETLREGYGDMEESDLIKLFNDECSEYQINWCSESRESKKSMPRLTGEYDRLMKI